MKIIEAMKQVKSNKEKIADLQLKIANTCANHTHETPLYPDTKAKVSEWLQSCEDTARDNVGLLLAIQKTNLATNVTIELGGKSVTKCIAEWVWRRREYAAMDSMTWSKLTDRNLKEGFMPTSTGQQMEIKIVRHYDPVLRDSKLAMYRDEPHRIDAALEVVNATTELVA
jgi:hypothetical protein